MKTKNMWDTIERRRREKSGDYKKRKYGKEIRTVQIEKKNQAMRNLTKQP